jgi:hypothetical protein
MKCARVEKFLPLYAAGDLAGGRRGRAIEKHLAACAQCRRTALEYQESRELFRAAALSPDFDGAFYDELRSSVLARIKRDRTLAPPSAFPKLFGARLAYAASLALLVIAAALALSAYMRRTPEDGARQNVLAGAKTERAATPTMRESFVAARPRSDDVQAPRPVVESARGTTGAARRATKFSSLKPDANIERAQNGSATRLHLMSRTPAAVARNTHAPTAAATARSSVGETAAARDGGEVTIAQPGVSRIEIQTSDPNIRIIWLSPDTKDPAGTLK